MVTAWCHAGWSELLVERLPSRIVDWTLLSMCDWPTILVVDDHQSARDTVQALLHTDPYKLEFASSGREVLERLEGPPVDLVVCDVVMPGMDGFEVCRAVKSHEQWRFVPIALVTALDGQDDMVRGIEAGADEFLTKPLDRVTLRSRVRAMLRIRRQYELLRTTSPDVESLLRQRRERVVDEAGLSVREREVLELLLLGRTHEDIAMVLGISIRTSKFHQANILQKLGAESRSDLTRLFI